MGPRGASDVNTQKIATRRLPKASRPGPLLPGRAVENGPRPAAREGSGAAGLRVRLSIVVVTYKTRDLLRSFLQSALQEMAGLEGVSTRVVVVDNASQDGTREMVTQEFPLVVFIENEENLGLAAALNRGLRVALLDSDLILLSNSDIVIHEGTLKKMVDWLLAHPELDGCCARLFNPDGSPQRTRTHIVYLLPERPHRSGPATFPGTTFALYRSSAFERVGGFDEVFFFYNEDLDWAERAKKAGLRFAYLADATVTHVRGAGRQRNASRILRDLYRLNLYYFRKHHPALASLAYLGLRLQLAWQRQRHVRELRRSGADPARREQLIYQLRDIEEARRRLETEWRRPSQPCVPDLSASG